MEKQQAALRIQSGKCFRPNWVEEEAVAALDIDDSKRSIQTIGHEGILTTEQKCKMETLTTTKAAHSPLKSPGFRQKGIRREQLEKHITQMIREKFQAELTPPEPEVDYCSTTQRDFCVLGFVPSRPKSKHMRDYKFEQAITFWSENCQKIQGVTPIRNPNSPFKKSSLFSTPISERLDEEELPPDL
ncbi:sperm associated antigen 8 [Cyprinodon tularosa]|uniref:sperm associated antigen 8 n=1 Tax=Cyprinodon tularosa TaxID=77115 RepID=UPI0018E205AC|nr:sperm associated antigen 8 [Cyprinodon tularosa]